MDLSALQHEILRSNKSASEKAEMCMRKNQANDLSKDEWRQLIAGIPEGVEKAIGILMSAGTQLHLHMTDSTGQQEGTERRVQGFAVVQETRCHSL